MTPPPVSTSRPRRLRSRIAAVLSWGYLLSLIAFVGLVRILGDRSWQVTLLAFAPRWIALLPLIVLIPLVLWANRKLLGVLIVAVLFAIFPLMGFCISYRHFDPPVVAGMPLRVLAYNVHHNYLEEAGLQQFLTRMHPDVISLEELPTNYDHGIFPRGIWDVVQHDELCLVSRYPIIAAHDIWKNALTKFTLDTPAGPVDFIGVHLSSPRFALRDTITGHEQGAPELQRNIRSRAGEARDMWNQVLQSSDRPLIIAGDFNLVPDSTLYASRFPSMTDCFVSTGLGFGWTYSNGWTIVRIDRVLSNPFFESIAFQIGPGFNSPHRPIVADLVLKPH